MQSQITALAKFHLVHLIALHKSIFQAKIEKSIKEINSSLNAVLEFFFFKRNCILWVPDVN